MKVIIFGSNECSLLAKFYLKMQGNTIVAFCENEKFIKNKSKERTPIVPFEKINKYFSPKDYVFFAPLYNNKLRELKSKEIKDKGYKLISFVSDKATVYTEKIGENCFISAGSTIIPKIEIGDNSIIAAGSVVIDNVPPNVMVAGVPSKIKKTI